jgi:RND family efflux transporter MFP subunit
MKSPGQLSCGVLWSAAILWACQEPQAPRSRDAKAIPVETAEVTHGRIDDARVFTGTLDAFSELAHAAKITGRVKSVSVDLGDAVAAGELLVTLDDEESRQAVRLAQADVTVAQAQQLEVQSGLQTAQRELSRVEALQAQKLMSEAALDAARTAERTATAARDRAIGALARAEAQLATARIQLGYTRIEAGPLEGGGTRVVSERHVDPSDAVAPGSPLVTTVEIDPLIAAISVTVADYVRIAIGQRATLATDALSGRAFEAEVIRIAPKFDEASRQARIELRVDNGQLLLKPGLFVRATLVLGEATDATIVPESALTRRGGKDGVFIVQAGDRVAFAAVEVGIRNGGRVQVRGEGITGRVVTLGQQLLDEGSTVIQPQATPQAQPSARPAASAPGSDG